MFYLNRTNRSGILSAGPIGGYEQNGDYKIDCRFNKETISKHRNKIKVYNQDISVFIKKYLPAENVAGDVFIYLDPPYYEKGQRLYLNHFSTSDHERLRADIAKIDCKWIMTYDDKVEIERLDHVYRLLIQLKRYQKQSVLIMRKLGDNKWKIVDFVTLSTT